MGQKWSQAPGHKSRAPELWERRGKRKFMGRTAGGSAVSLPSEPLFGRAGRFLALLQPTADGKKAPHSQAHAQQRAVGKDENVPLHVFHPPAA